MDLPFCKGVRTDHKMSLMWSAGSIGVWNSTSTRPYIIFHNIHSGASDLFWSRDLQPSGDCISVALSCEEKLLSPSDGSALYHFHFITGSIVCMSEWWSGNTIVLLSVMGKTCNFCTKQYDWIMNVGMGLNLKVGGSWHSLTEVEVPPLGVSNSQNSLNHQCSTGDTYMHTTLNFLFFFFFFFWFLRGADKHAYCMIMHILWALNLSSIQAFSVSVNSLRSTVFRLRLTQCTFTTSQDILFIYSEEQRRNGSVNPA